MIYNGYWWLHYRITQYEWQQTFIKDPASCIKSQHPAYNKKHRFIDKSPDYEGDSYCINRWIGISRHERTTYSRIRTSKHGIGLAITGLLWGVYWPSYLKGGPPPLIKDQSRKSISITWRNHVNRMVSLSNLVNSRANLSFIISWQYFSKISFEPFACRVVEERWTSMPILYSSSTYYNRTQNIVK